MQAYNEIYKKNAISTATPERLIAMLYDGAIGFLDKGINALESGDMENASKMLIRVQDIIYELMSSLDLKRGGEIAQNLYNLYEYMNYRIVNANTQKKAEPAKEAKSMIEDLRSTWNSAIEQHKASMDSGDSRRVVTA